MQYSTCAVTEPAQISNRHCGAWGRSRARGDTDLGSGGWVLNVIEARLLNLTENRIEEIQTKTKI